METIIGPYSSELGINGENLFEKLLLTEKSAITKGLIWEIYKYVISSQCTSLKFTDFLQAVQTLYNLDNLPDSTLRSSINRIKLGYNALTKNTKTEEQLKAPKLFLREPYQAQNTELGPHKRKNPAPQHDEESAPKAKKVDPQEKLKLLQRQVELLERENAKLNSKNTKLQQKLVATNANLKRVYTLS